MKGRTGELASNWKGDNVLPLQGNRRAIRLYPDLEPCAMCGELDKRKRKMHRHHVDGNTFNNDPNNILWLCYSCHRFLESKADKYKMGVRLKIKINKLRSKSRINKIRMVWKNSFNC